MFRHLWLPVCRSGASLDPVYSIHFFNGLLALAFSAYGHRADEQWKSFLAW